MAPSRYEAEDISDFEDDHTVGTSGATQQIQSPYFTQPTQLASFGDTLPSRNRGHSPQISSPVNETIEIPASSPFQTRPPMQPSQISRLMAPPGTEFRPPVPAPKPTMRRYSDSSDDDSSKPQRSLSSMLTPHSDLVNRVFLYNRKIFPKEKCAAALKRFGNHWLDAARHLHHPKVFDMDYDHRGGGKYEPVEKYLPEWFGQAPPKEPSPQPPKQDQPRPMKRPAPEVPFETIEDSPTPPKRLKRLQRGRRPRDSSPVAGSSQPFSPTSPKVAVPIISLVSDDEEPTTPVKKAKETIVILSDNEEDDDFSSSAPVSPSSSSDADIPGRALRYLNECNAIQLMAITGMKEPRVEAMLKHQPFKTLEAAQKVTIAGPKKGRPGNKDNKVAIGEDVVEALISYIEKLDDIEKILDQCEERNKLVKKTTSAWSLDSVGQARGKASNRPLPIASEPKAVKGHCTLKSYQLFGVNWMYQLYERRYGGILADEMGLGKTCQVISFVAALVEGWDERSGTQRPYPNLVVVPPSTLENWQNEFVKFAPGLEVTTYRGSQYDRDDIASGILENGDAPHVILTTYSQMNKYDVMNFQKIRPHVAVFDEGHRLKNPKANVHQDLKKIPTEWRLILTGTPVQNNLMEMIGLLSFLEPELFHRHGETLEALFNQKFSVNELSKGVGLHKDKVGRARTILEPFILQRRKQQVLKDLPPKTRQVVSCTMGKAQKALYQTYHERYVQQLQNRTSTAGQKATARPAKPKSGRSNDENNNWMQLRKAALHPLLFRKIFTDKICEKMADILLKSVPHEELRQDNPKHMADELKNCSDFQLHLWCRDYPKQLSKFDLPDGTWLDCGKVKSLMKLLHEYKKTGEKALVFTKFATVIEILSECMVSEGIEYTALQGSTSVQERQGLIDEFTDSEDMTVFLLTTGAGGTGINLTAATKVIIFDMSDNPQDDAQAENRAHRIGQTKPVEIIRLVSEETVETIIHQACLKKLELADKVTGWETDQMESGEMEAEVRKELEMMN